MEACTVTASTGCTKVVARCHCFDDSLSSKMVTSGTCNILPVQTAREQPARHATLEPMPCIASRLCCACTLPCFSFKVATSAVVSLRMVAAVALPSISSAPRRNAHLQRGNQ